jgi:hypothetical protein
MKWLLLAFMVTSCFASDNFEMTQIEPSSVRASEALGNVKLYHDGSSFLLERNDSGKMVIDTSQLDILLRKIVVSSHRVEQFQKCSFIKVDVDCFGDYFLTSHVRGPGGGLILGGGVAISGYGGAILLGVLGTIPTPASPWLLGTAAFLAASTPVAATIATVSPTL